ncbi:MAG: DUF5615 family PIN-like protein [Acidobacteriota bacterium]
MSGVQYLLDENVGPAVRTALLAREPSLTVWRVGMPGAPPYGTKDPALLAWCEDNGFILVTENRTSMPRHLGDHLASGRHVPGVLVLSPKLSVREAVDELLLISGATREDELVDRIVHVPVS